MEKYKKSIIVRLTAVFLIFNLFYFLNIIPPIPLSLKEISVYHDVQKTSTFEYLASYEPTPWYVFWKKRSTVIHRDQSDDIYVFTQVFAPTKLQTNIIHSWQYFEKETGEWKDSTKIALTISGGRKQGYRGFSKKQALTPGVWRVVIETSRGQRLGGIRFRIIEDGTQPILINEKL